MLTSMFNTLFPSIKKENKTMANSTQYVVYTRNFKSRAKQIGVFAEPASSYKVNGEVHGGKIKFKNLAVKSTARKTATNKLLSKGLDFTVEVLGTPAGNILKELFKSGIKLGISSRGLGSVKEMNEDDSVEVQPDFELIAFDFVSNPSTHGAFLSPTNEGKLHEGVGTRDGVCCHDCKIENIINDIFRGE